MKISYRTIAILVLLVIVVLSTFRCSHNANKAKEYESNIDYLTDTVTAYRDRAGRAGKERTLLVASLRGLEALNKALRHEIKQEMGKVKFVSTTKLKYNTDTLYRDGTTTFTVLSDSVLTDFSLSLDTLVLGMRDGKVFAKATNKHVVIEDIDAVEIEKRIRSLGFGFFAGPVIGYNPIDKDLDLAVGVGVGLVFKVK